MIKLLDNPEYKPEKLLNAVSSALKLRSDAALARRLDITPPVICRMRMRAAPIHADLLLRMHDATGMSMDELRAICGIPKTDLKFYKHDMPAVPASTDEPEGDEDA